MARRDDDGDGSDDGNSDVDASFVSAASEEQVRTRPSARACQRASAFVRARVRVKLHKKPCSIHPTNHMRLHSQDEGKERLDFNDDSMDGVSGVSGMSVCSEPDSWKPVSVVTPNIPHFQL